MAFLSMCEVFLSLAFIEKKFISVLIIICFTLKLSRRRKTLFLSKRRKTFFLRWRRRRCVRKWASEYMGWKTITKNRRKIPHPSRPETCFFVVVSSSFRKFIEYQSSIYSSQTNTAAIQRKSTQNAHGYAQYGFCCVRDNFRSSVGYVSVFLSMKTFADWCLSWNPFRSLAFVADEGFQWNFLSHAYSVSDIFRK